MRIISLVPSLTELLSDLGLHEEVVGITKFCVHPVSWFQSKIKVGGTKNVNLNKVALLRPDIIIANKEENDQTQIEALSQDFKVLLTDIKSLDDALAVITEIGILVSKVTEAQQLNLKILTAFQGITPLYPPIKSCYFIWRKPYMISGCDTFINDMMRYCGFENCFNNISRYPEVKLDEVVNSGARLILLSSEPYPFAAKHLQEFITQLPASNIQLVDGEMFSWYGSRLLLAPEYFKSLIRHIITNAHSRD